MNQKTTCPCCSYPLVRQFQARQLSWFCTHCRQVVPYAVEKSATPAPRSLRTCETSWGHLQCVMPQVESRIEEDRLLKTMPGELEALLNVRLPV